MISLKLFTEFSCAHFYSRPDWGEEKNKAEFGKCYSKESRGHGHDYRLEVEVFCDPSSLIITEGILKESLDFITNEFDHRHLNLDFQYFKTEIPTSENISLLLAAKYKKQWPHLKIKTLRLFEKSDLYVEPEI